MVTMDCTRCPAGPRDCEGCPVSVLMSENLQVDELSEESCGYVLPPGIRSAVEVLLEVGVVSTVEIMAVEAAA